VSDEPSAGPGATVRVARVPIRIEPAFVLVLGLLGFAGRGTLFASIEWVVLAGISILLHELGHAAAYRRFGIEPRIRLYAFGGLTYGQALPPARSIVVCLAGPATGLAIGLVVLAVSAAFGSRSGGGPPELEAIVADLLYINVAWSAFNLLPMLPLDGGNIAADAFRAAKRSSRLAIDLSLVVSGAITVIALLAGQFYIAILGVSLVAWNWRSRTSQREDPQRRLLRRAWNELDHDVAAARKTASEVAARPRSHEIRFEAVEILGWVALANRSQTEVSDALDRLGDGVVGSRLFRACAHLALEGDVEGMAEGLAAAYTDRRRVPTLKIAGGLIADAGLVDLVIEEAEALPAVDQGRSLLWLQMGLHENDRYADSIRVGTLLFERQDGLDTAYAAAWIAESLIKSGDQPGGVTWLGRALERGMPWSDIAGYPGFAALIDDPSFASIRSPSTAPPA
jgi:stage IV sporulation protein FB